MVTTEVIAIGIDLSETAHTEQIPVRVALRVEAEVVDGHLRPSTPAGEAIAGTGNEGMEIETSEAPVRGSVT